MSNVKPNHHPKRRELEDYQTRHTEDDDEEGEEEREKIISLQIFAFVARDWTR